MADMIAYLGKDRIDALDMGVIDSFDAFESNYIGRSNVMILNNMIVDIVNHSFGRDRISMSPEAFRDIKRAKEQNYALIYRREGMSDAHADMMQEMFEELYEKLLGDLRRKDESSPVFRHHVGYLARKSHSITRESYLREDPDTIVVDYISSMTDSYFSALYAHLFPNSDKRVVTRTYTDDLR